MNTSKAKIVPIIIYNYDNIPLSITYTAKSPVAPIDLTNYSFNFILKNNKTTVKNYEITAGDLSTAFLSKVGADVNTLDMQLMFQDIRDNHLSQGSEYRLIQVVTDPSNNIYVHIVYVIDVRRY